MPLSISTPSASPHAPSRAHSFTRHRPSAPAAPAPGQFRFGADYVAFGQPIDGPHWDLTLLDRLQVPLTRYHE